MIRIVAIDPERQRREMTDLSWFEEEGIHDWAGEGHWTQYTFEIYADDRRVFPPEEPW